MKPALLIVPFALLIIVLPFAVGCLPNAPAPPAVRKRLTETELQKVEFISDDGRQIRCPICGEVADIESMRFGSTINYRCSQHEIIVDAKSETIWACSPR